MNLRQRYALDSWQRVANRVCFANRPGEVDLISNVDVATVTLFDADNPPSLRQLAEHAASLGGPDPIAISNSDIVIHPRILRIFRVLEVNPFEEWAATGPRWTVESFYDMGSASITDWGLDVFLAPSGVWKRVANDVPQFLCLGSTLWDNWLNGWFGHNLRTYINMQPWKCMFHERHESTATNPYTPEQSASLTFPFNGLPPMQFK